MKKLHVKIDNIVYTIRHKVAYLRVEKQLLGRNTLRGYRHDLDKIWLYIRYNDDKLIQKKHRENNEHHVECTKGIVNLLELIIDCECARYTKPDKPLNAYDTIKKYYPEYLDKCIPALIKLGLVERSNHDEHVETENINI